MPYPRANPTLRRVSATRRCLHSPDLGYCLGCDEPIADARLLHATTTLRCLEYASVQESDARR